MGVSQGSFTNSGDIEPVHTHFSAESGAVCDDESDGYCGHGELKVKSLIYRMIWDFGLACLIPPSRRRSSGKGKGGENSEHNKAWLLAQSGGCGRSELTNAEPQSVHSSFRLSLCSQVELESMNVSSCSPATVLMVNLENGLTDPGSRELKWRRIESLERSISPVAHSLVRFSYDEIVSATSNFSKGTQFGSLFVEKLIAFYLVS